jgi:hypothetical protein
VPDADLLGGVRSGRRPGRVRWAATNAADRTRLRILMAASSRVPGVIRTARILGIVQAGVWITATMWLSIDTVAAGDPPLTLGDIAGLVVALLLMGGLILVASLCLTQARPGPRVVLLMAESLVLIGVLAFVGIAAEITAPLALAIIVCLLLPGGRRPIRERGQVRETSP